jgi:hypothetical protein
MERTTAWGRPAPGACWGMAEGWLVVKGVVPLASRTGFGRAEESSRDTCRGTYMQAQIKQEKVGRKAPSKGAKELQQLGAWLKEVKKCACSSCTKQSKHSRHLLKQEFQLRGIGLEHA